jgi:hypothetical protein
MMDWRKQLYHLEMPPPEPVWENLARELRYDPSSLRRSLRADEVAPPPDAWEQIRIQVQDTQPENAIRRVPQRWAPIRQYVAAAAVIGLTVAGIYYLSPVGHAPIPADQVSTSLYPSSDSQKGRASARKMAAPTAGTGHEANPEARSSESPSGSALPSTGPPAFSNTLAAGAPGGNTKKPTARKGSVKEPELVYTDGNYIQVAGADGQYRRVSYKCRNMLPCLVKGGKIPRDTQACEGQVEMWKQQLGRSGLVPAGDNFFDIAEMARLLGTSK